MRIPAVTRTLLVTSHSSCRNRPTSPNVAFGTRTGWVTDGGPSTIGDEKTVGAGPRAPRATRPIVVVVVVLVRSSSLRSRYTVTPAVRRLRGAIWNVACTSTPGVHTCCRVSLSMFNRNTSMGKNARARYGELRRQLVAQQSILTLVVRRNVRRGHHDARLRDRVGRRHLVEPAPGQRDLLEEERLGEVRKAHVVCVTTLVLELDRV